MAEEKLIQISLQLPVSELAEVTALVEQIQQLLANNNQVSIPQERGESSRGFDEVRFRELEQTAAAKDRSALSAQPETAEVGFTDVSAGKTREDFSFSEVAAPTSARDHTWQRIQPVSSNVSVESVADTPASLPTAVNDLRSNPPREAEIATPANAPRPNFSAETETTVLPEETAADVRAAEFSSKDAIQVRTLQAAVETDIDPKTSPTSVESHITVPRTADPTVSDNIGTFLPERQRDAEQLVSAGPAPLTAEAVSLAFRRDDRRYDNGFPLY